ncbi:MAG: universal stress protein [Flavobacteriaceae bacterium]|nr:universal stress protein [Flavobacteriaceae bacterium]
MKNILLPTDFSENSWNAIQYAMELFKDEPCNFYVFNSYRLPAYTTDDFMVTSTNEDLEETLFKTTSENLDKILQRINERKKNPKHTFRKVSEYNFFLDAIKEVVKKNDIDLIVMGTKGATGAKEIFIGTNTGDVINKVKVPLIVIPENTVYKPPKEIAFPTDHKVFYKRKALKTLLKIADLHKSAIRIVHVKMEKIELTSEQLANKNFMFECLENINHSYHTLHNLMLEDALNCFTQSRDIDMIAMVPKNLNFFQKLFFKPKVEEISYHTNIPLLVLHKSN